jgi:4'-phosphopantetheinyl transferase
MPASRTLAPKATFACVRAVELEIPGGAELSVHRLRYHFAAEPGRETLGCLTEDERERMAKFRFVEDRVRFAGTRALLRTLLAAELELAPDRVPLELGPNGKPLLAPACSLHFNVSHSGDLGLVALSRNNPVGVDVERMRPDVEFRSVAARVFAPSELRALAALDDPAALARFYRGWTYKEAVLKALGVGLGAEPRTFAVLEGDGPDLTVEPSALATPLERVRVSRVPVPEGYAAAVAVIA